MAITRFDPFREFATLHGRMNRLFGDVYLGEEDVNGRSTWVPPVDIYETEGQDLVVKAELPDLRREDIEVTVEHNTLTIRGERKCPSEVKEDLFRRVERQVREVQPLVHAAQHGRRVEGERGVPERCPRGEAPVPRRRQAADGERRSRGITPRCGSRPAECPSRPFITRGCLGREPDSPGRRLV